MIKAGDIIRVHNDHKPKGLVPIKHMQLVYECSDSKWYAFEVQKTLPYVGELSDSLIMKLMPPK